MLRKSNAESSHSTWNMRGNVAQGIRPPLPVAFARSERLQSRPELPHVTIGRDLLEANGMLRSISRLVWAVGFLVSPCQGLLAQEPPPAPSSAEMSRRVDELLEARLRAAKVEPAPL